MSAQSRSEGSIRTCVDDFDWTGILTGLDDVGVSLTPPVLNLEDCRTLSRLYDDDTRFRSTIDMARHRFGAGHYRYFSHPLPALVTELRSAFWRHLLPIARDWAARRAMIGSQIRSGASASRLSAWRRR